VRSARSRISRRNDGTGLYDRAWLRFVAIAPRISAAIPLNVVAHHVMMSGTIWVLSIRSASLDWFYRRGEMRLAWC
jgi:hypothetical protein